MPVLRISTHAITLIALALCRPVAAQISLWQIGGDGLAWEESDTTRIMIDVDGQANRIRPVYFGADDNMYLAVTGWSELITPHELGYIDGHQPRLWSGDGTNINWTSYFDSPLYVDGMRSTYNTARDGWWTIDVGVPVPAASFGFVTPTEGVRSDGVPLNQDPVPAYEVSIAAEAPEALAQRGYYRLGTLIADVPVNFETEVEIDFPQQYVRFVRYLRKSSVLDEQGTTDSNTVRGTIAEFLLKGRGVPKRVVYRTKILDLGHEVNFGRIGWSARGMRMIDGVPTEVDDADAWVEVEARTGRDDDPNIYHEYTDSGKEFVVTRAHFENELRRLQGGPNIKLDQQPGIRASIAYDSDNWSFWSSPNRDPGAQLRLRNGAYLQLQITLQSRAFDDWVELDSLWIETAPPLADQIVGEVARLEEMQPARGFTQVELGQREDFVYDVRASFGNAAQGGFDGLRIRTGSRPRFARLEMGAPLQLVEPLVVSERDEELEVLLPRKVTRGSNEPLRVIFDTEVFLHATTFGGEVFDSGAGSLPQPVEPGDAGEGVSTSSLRVLGGEGRTPRFIQRLQFSTGVVTPNGDGVNDRLTIDYELFLLPEPIPVEIHIYDLQGRRLTRIEVGEQEAGPQRISWDGRDERGQILTPGLYLLDVNLRAELKSIRHLRPIGVAY
jgi:hypothetical protein